MQDDPRPEHGVAQLFGPGDLLDPRALAGQPLAWRVLTPARLAVLDTRFTAVAQRCPSLLSWLAHRLFDGRREQHELTRIRGLPRVEQRILELLQHLSERWGRVTLEGISLTLPLTHRELGRLVGARRPTVSLALKELRDLGVVHRDRGRFLLTMSQGTGERAEPRSVAWVAELQGMEAT